MSTLGGKKLTGSAASGGGVSGLTSADGGDAIADNEVIRGDGTTGIQGSVATLSDAGKFATTGAASPQYGFSADTAAADAFAGVGVSSGAVILYGSNAGGNASVQVLNVNGNVGTGRINLPSGAAMYAGAPTATTPTMTPTVGDSDTGLGAAAADQLSMIAGGVEVIRCTEGATGQSDGPTFRVVVDTNASGPVSIAATVADSGKCYANTGATGPIAFNLPAASVGLFYGFTVVADEDVVVTANGTDTIRIAGSVSTAGGTATNGTTGGTLWIHCPVAGAWYAMNAPNGTWSLSA